MDEKDCFKNLFLGQPPKPKFSGKLNHLNSRGNETSLPIVFKSKMVSFFV